MIELLIAFFAGISVKLVDLAEDHGLKMNKVIKILFSIMYGLLIAYIISVVNILPELWIGILLGLLFAGKIDALGHYIGFGSAILFILMFGLPTVNPLIILLIAIICVLEEWVNDNIVDKKKVKGILLNFLSIRPLLEITAIVFSIIYANISIFLLLLSFDLGYLITKKIKK